MTVRFVLNFILVIFKKSEKPWLEAVDKCNAYGGDMVRIYDEQQQADFNNWITQKEKDWDGDKVYKGSWIALTVKLFKNKEHDRSLSAKFIE